MAKKVPKQSQKVLDRTSSQNEKSIESFEQNAIDKIFSELKSTHNKQLILRKVDMEFFHFANQYRNNILIGSQKALMLTYSTKMMVNAIRFSQDSDPKIFKVNLKQNFKFMELVLKITPDLENFQSKLFLFFSSILKCGSALTAQKELLERIQTFENDLLLSMVATIKNTTLTLENSTKICVFGFCPHIVESLKFLSKNSKPRIHVLLVKSDSKLNDKMELSLRKFKIQTTVTNLQSLGHFKEFLKTAYICLDFIFTDGVAYSRRGSGIFANLHKAYCPKGELIGCCESFKCINYPSNQWKSHISGIEGYEMINNNLITILNTESSLLKNWSVLQIIFSKLSFNEKYLNDAFWQQKNEK